MEEARGQWRRGFLIQCEVAGHQTKGAGPNKKLAKRNAAESVYFNFIQFEHLWGKLSTIEFFC